MNEVLSEVPEGLWLCWVGVISLIVGSFLNVVIYRIPRMINKESYAFCHTFLRQRTALPEEYIRSFNLVWPLSHCPHCLHTIRPWHNIPIFSYLWLKGRCAYCQRAISQRYILIEVICLISSLMIAWHFGPSSQAIAALIFHWILLCLVFIDLDCHLLPDNLTLLLLWLGLLVSLFNVFIDPATAIIGASSGYLLFWCVGGIFRWIARQEGMGYGDYKLLAALGAWLGWELLPLVVFIAAVTGLIVTIIFKIITRQKIRGVPFAFGPFLAIAAWTALIMGHDMNYWYLTYVGIL